MYIPFEDGEEVLIKVHRHWLFIVLRLVGLACMLVVPFIVVLVVTRVGFVVFTGASGAALVTLWSLWGLMCWGVFWQFWTTYYMDIWVITNRRIIDIDYVRLFDRDIAVQRLHQVEDVATRVTGLVGTLLKYGSVVVQTAGSNREFVMNQIADPEHLRDIIFTAAEAARQYPH